MTVAPRSVALIALLSGALASAPQLSAQTGESYDPALFSELEYRMIGPYRGGRSTAVTGIADRLHTFFVGTTGGGVWKTENAGQSWTNVSDGYFAVGSIGALDVADTDPDVIYVGTGSACIRGNVSTGRGLYKSEDGGESWRFIGLRDIGQVGDLLIHPDDPDLAYVAALGHAFGHNPERGVYRTQDGGRTWQNILFISDSTGVVDLAMNPHDPDEMYAAAWHARRTPWTMISGGTEGGLYKTMDGGESWERLTNGLPDGVIGKMGVTLSPADPDRVWVLVEAPGDRGGVYRSDDAGRSWRQLNSEAKLRERPWYYTHIDADPADPNTVWVNSDNFFKSTDGGETWERVRTPHGDNHDIWINPDHPDVMVQANDGGVNVSVDRARSWSTQYNQPTAEFYSVEVDNRFPYRVYGPQQDNSTITVSSDAPGGVSPQQYWYAVGGCETGPIAVRPDDPDVVYAGCLGGRITRFDRKTGQEREIRDYPELEDWMPARDLRYRYQWNAPIELSPHDPGILYHASQYVHRSLDEGQSWELISPDLTRNDPSKQALAGEPITHDGSGVEIYNTIFALAESPHRPGLIWAGTNDGLVHITRDDGESWQEITPPDLPEWTTVSGIELSPHDPGTAYVAAYRYRFDDYRPYIYRTDDYGETWTLLTTGENGIPADHPTRVVREDPEREGLLYAGTEFGLFVSFDDGATWQSFQLNLPATPVTDLELHRGDLVVATQGRSFWILDDVSVLRQISPQLARSAAHLFEPRPAHRTDGGRFRGGIAPEPAPDGATIHYLVGRSDRDVTLEILDDRGAVVRTFSSAAANDEDALPTDPGLHRFVWDLRYPGWELDMEEGQDRPIYVYGGGVDGGEPPAVPGRYRVRLRVGDAAQTRDLRVMADPRVDASPADLREQHRVLLEIRDRMTRMHDGLREARAARTRIEEALAELEGSGDDETVREAGAQLRRELADVEATIIQTDTSSSYDQPPRLTRHYSYLFDVVSSADARPTDQSYERLEDLNEQMESQMQRLERLLGEDMRRFEQLLERRNITN